MDRTGWCDQHRNRNRVTLEFNLYGQHLNGEWGPKGDAVFASDGFQLAPTDFDSKYRTTQLSGKVSGL